MSSQREHFHSSQPRTTTRSPRTQDSSLSGSFAIGQGGRSSSPLTPPSLPTSRSPVPFAPNAPLNPRQYAEHHEAATGMPSEWPYGMPSQALSPGRGSYGTTQEPSARQLSPYYASHLRATPAPTSSSHSSRYSNYPAGAQSDWDRYQQYASTGAPEHEHSPFATAGYDYALDTGTQAYAGSYVYASPTDPSPTYHYAHTPAYEPRNSSSQAMFTNALPSAASMGPASRSVASAVRGATRSHAHTSHHAPYTVPSRSRAPVNSASGAGSSVGDMTQEVKKKRKRADAHQLKVLNEVYDRNPFPPTVEREQLAQQLSMTPRSVQIWFQNKRQAARQGGRGGQPPKPSEGSSSIPDPSAGYSSSRHSHPHVPGSTHASVIEAPSASAPRGAPGYVASPTLRARTSSPPRPASAPYHPQTVFVEAYQPPSQSRGAQPRDEQAGPSTRSTRRRS